MTITQNIVQNDKFIANRIVGVVKRLEGDKVQMDLPQGLLAIARHSSQTIVTKSGIHLNRIQFPIKLACAPPFMIVMDAQRRQ